MGTLPYYKNFIEKSKSFKSSKRLPGQRIETKEAFDKWYNRWKEKSENREKYTNFFRGMGEANYKLLTSAQRAWISNKNAGSAVKLTYRDFFDKLINTAGDNPVLKLVFNHYGFTNNEKSDFTALSLIQHYGGCSPLMDWSYNMDVALYFATEKMKGTYPGNSIENYFSVYRINNKGSGINSLQSVAPREYPSLREMMEKFKKGKLSPGRLFYFSDFDNSGTAKNLATIYNHNIIPQQGLFIFNPSRINPLEDYFPDTNSNYAQIRCYDIHKSLAGHVRQRLKAGRIGKSFIYPDLKKIIKGITANTVSDFFKQPALIPGALSSGAVSLL